MEKIFYTHKSVYPDSESALQRILTDFFGITDAKIARLKTGKPYLSNYPNLFFSVSHTDGMLFFAFSDENVGIDAEANGRDVDYVTVSKRFSPVERAEITDKSTFLRHWTALESAVKWLGGSLAKDLRKLRFEKNTLFYGEIELPVHVCFFQIAEHTVCVCGERDFSGTEQIVF